MKLMRFVFFIGLGALIFVSSLAADDVVFTGELLVRAIENCLNGEAPDVIGWSKNGKMAYVDFMPGAEPNGRPEACVGIVNLVTDEVVFHRQCGRSGEGPAFDEAAVRAAVARLKRLGVFSAPTAGRQFPMFAGDEVISLTVSEEKVGEADYDTGDGQAGTIKLPKTKFTLVCKKERANLTKRLETVLTGPYVIGDDNRVVSYYQSPYENRIAIPYYAGTVEVAGVVLYRGDNGFVGCNLGVGFK